MTTTLTPGPSVGNATSMETHRTLTEQIESRLGHGRVPHHMFFSTPSGTSTMTRFTEQWNKMQEANAGACWEPYPYDEAGPNPDPEHTRTNRG